MGEAFILRRGGTGGMSVNNAVIHVNAPTGSTLTFSKSGVTVKVLGPGNGHLNVDGYTADYYYSVSTANYGTWTVTGTSGTFSHSLTVTVSANRQYDLKLVYQTMLYDAGNLYEYPWKISMESDPSYQNPSGTKLLVNQNGNTNFYPHIGFFVNQAIDLTNHSSLCAHIYGDTTNLISSAVVFVSPDVKTTGQLSYYLYNQSATLAHKSVEYADWPEDMVIRCDISGIQGEKYVNVGGIGNSAYLSCTFVVDSVWLE